MASSRTLKETKPKPFVTAGHKQAYPEHEFWPPPRSSEAFNLLLRVIVAAQKELQSVAKAKQTTTDAASGPH